MGVDTLVVSLAGGGTLDVTGVWQSVSQGNMADEGGLMPEVDTSIICDASPSLNRSLVGRTGTAKGLEFRIRTVDEGEAQTTVFLEDITEIL